LGAKVFKKAGDFTTDYMYYKQEVLSISLAMFRNKGYQQGIIY
jgi:hypothetical protein